MDNGMERGISVNLKIGFNVTQASTSISKIRKREDVIGLLGTQKKRKKQESEGKTWNRTNVQIKWDGRDFLSKRLWGVYEKCGVG